MKKARNKKLPYQEGDWFAVPLLTDGYAIGIVARMNGKGQVLGYFFAPKFEVVPNSEVTEGWLARDTIFIRAFGDRSLSESGWPVLGKSSRWNRDDWPVPKFATRDAKALPNRAWIVERGDDLRVIRRRLTILEEAEGLPEDAFSGSEALRVHLTKILDPEGYQRLRQSPPNTE